MDVQWIYPLIGGVILLPVLTWLMSAALSPTRIKLAGKHVLITGGSSGIGHAIALCAAKEGAHVSILARNVDRLAKAKQAIKEAAMSSSSSSSSPSSSSSSSSSLLPASQRIEAVSADVCEWESVSEAICKCVEASGPLDVLVCNAGSARPGVFETESIDTLKYQMSLNWLGTIHTIKAALPYLKQRGDVCEGEGGEKGERREGGGGGRRGTEEPGCITIVSSQAGQVGVYGFSGYSSSKFALRGLAEVLQQELSCYNIRLCLAHPPDTDTPGMMEEDKTKPELTKYISGTTSLCQPKEVAADIIEGIKSGRFIVSTGFVGGILAMVTAGMSPQNFLVSKVMEILLMGLTRLIALVIVSDWYAKIDKWRSERKGGK